MPEEEIIENVLFSELEGNSIKSTLKGYILNVTKSL
jgi:hypothetical protein